MRIEQTESLVDYCTETSDSSRVIVSSPFSQPLSDEMMEVTEDEAVETMAQDICGALWGDENTDQYYHRQTAKRAYRALHCKGLHHLTSKGIEIIRQQK